MHFGLTEEQELLQDSVRKLLEHELPPARLRTLFDVGEGFDATLWNRAAEVGLQGLIVPEEWSGSGLELLDLALAFEVLGESAAPGPFLGHALATLAVKESGSREQKERWLPRLASGECVAGCAFSEDGDRWLSDDWQLAPNAKSNSLSGTKRFAELAPTAEVFVVGLSGGGLALVDRDASGLRIETIDGLDRGRPLVHLDFDSTPIELLDAVPGGPESAGARICDAASILLAADSFGAAWRLIRMTTEYALARQQFGTPIAQFQAVKHQLANMAAAAEPMRGLVWYAAYAFDHRREECPRDASLAKAHITDGVVGIGRDAVAIHGGIGFTWECDVQFWVKRGMMNRVWMGSPEAHRRRAANLGGY